MLTKGEFGVTDVLTFTDDVTEEEILKYAASVESHSEHPIAKAITTAVNELFKVEEFKSIPGKGAEGKVNGKHIMIVSPGYLREKGMVLKDERAERIASQGKTIVYVLIDGQLRGAIALADIVRPESKKAISMLKKMGIKCMMLTGDNKQVAKWVAEEIGLDEYFAEVLPHEKSQSDKLKNSVKHITQEIQKQIPGISLQEYITPPRLWPEDSFEI